MKKENILRRSRFEHAQKESTSTFLSSMTQDEKIFDADIWVDKAHILMLSRQGIVGNGETLSVLQALDLIASADKRLLMSKECEDVHVLIETELIERLGEEVGGRIHTARSRNDEVATCMRISLRNELLDLLEALTNLQRILLELASENLDTIMPGYTHLQHAQATTLAHYLMAHAVALQRDSSRLMSCYEVANVNPLGAAAMSSTSFPIDPHYTAELLAFREVASNSIDAVASRDFLLDALCALSIMGITLSRLTEELILWSTAEFGFIELADEYSSTSSIMPQKRNPDVVELVRGRISSILGALFSAMSICKSLPLAYNRDLQEATVHLWHGTETMKSILPILGGMLSTMKIDKQRMEEASTQGMRWATDLANMLVADFDLAFRTAHSIVAEVSRTCDEGTDPERLSDVIAQVSRRTAGREVRPGAEGILQAMNARSQIGLRKVSGGPAPSEVSRSLRRTKKGLEKNASWVDDERERIRSAKAKVEALQASLGS